jgi:hypothetical protein
MTTYETENGGVLLGSLWVGLLLAMLGGVAMNLAVTETTASARHVDEKVGLLLAESGVGQVAAWLMHREMPLSDVHPMPVRFMGTAGAPDMEYDAARTDDDRILNGARADMDRTMADFGRITRARLYGPNTPEGFCTVEVAAESQRGVRRTVSIELGALRIPPLKAAVQAGLPVGAPAFPKVLAHWGDLTLAGDAHLGRASEFPRKSAEAAVTGLGYGEDGALQEDRWVEAWIGGTPQFDEPQPIMPPNMHASQDPVPSLPLDPWQYRLFKEHARRFGTYYVPDREGRLYKDGVMDPAAALLPPEVFGSRNVGDQRGLVFIDTLDQEPPTETNLATLVVGSAYLEGTFYINAHMVLQPAGRGQTLPVLSPPPQGPYLLALRVPVSIKDVTVFGVLHTAGTLRIEGQVRVFGSVIAERGLVGSGLLEVWYDADLGRGLVRGLPMVFPVPGTWREWGS